MSYPLGARPGLSSCQRGKRLSVLISPVPLDASNSRRPLPVFPHPSAHPPMQGRAQGLAGVRGACCPIHCLVTCVLSRPPARCPVWLRPICVRTRPPAPSCRPAPPSGGEGTHWAWGGGGPGGCMELEGGAVSPSSRHPTSLRKGLPSVTPYLVVTLCLGMSVLLSGRVLLSDHFPWYAPGHLSLSPCHWSCLSSCASAGPPPAMLSYHPSPLPRPGRGRDSEVRWDVGTDGVFKKVV
jgi:hypothetical protein